MKRMKKYLLKGIIQNIEKGEILQLMKGDPKITKKLLEHLKEKCMSENETNWGLQLTLLKNELNIWITSIGIAKREDRIEKINNRRVKHDERTFQFHVSWFPKGLPKRKLMCSQYPNGG